MSNDTTTLGFLRPISVLPINDRPLEDLIGDMLAGITGYDRNDVRPRLQPQPPNLPDQERDWVAFGVNMTGQDNFAAVTQLPALSQNGQGVVERDEFFDVLCSFYGAHSSEYMAVWRDGLSLDQNRWVLWDHGIKLLGFGFPVNVPSLVKDRYSRRIDLAAQFARRVNVTYGIRNIASADGQLHTEVLPPIPITVSPPNP